MCVFVFVFVLCVYAHIHLHTCDVYACIYIYIPKQSELIYLGTLATTENPKQSGLGYLGYLGGEMQFGKLEN